jgi:hypothetical protein
MTRKLTISGFSPTHTALRSSIFITLVLLLGCIRAQGQAHELGVTVGGDFVNSGGFSVDPQFAGQVSYAHRLLHVPLVGLYGELPVAVASKNVVRFTSVPTSTSGFSSVFFTPSLKLKITAIGTQPYFVVGGGLGHFGSSQTGGSTNTGTVDYGAGVDFTALPHLGLRAEARDYYSGSARFGLAGGDRQHNVFVTGGIVLKF